MSLITPKTADAQLPESARLFSSSRTSRMVRPLLILSWPAIAVPRLSHRRRPDRHPRHLHLLDPPT